MILISGAVISHYTNNDQIYSTVATELGNINIPGNAPEQSFVLISCNGKTGRSKEGQYISFSDQTIIKVLNQGETLKSVLGLK